MPIGRDWMRKLIEDAESAGWSVGRTARNHLKFERDGQVLFSSGTPGDRRVVKNLRAKLRRASKRNVKV